MNFASSTTDYEPVATHNGFYSRCLNRLHSTLNGLHLYSRLQATTRQTTFPLSWPCHSLSSQTNISSRSCLTEWRSCRLTLPRCERFLRGTKHRKSKTSTRSWVNHLAGSQPASVLTAAAADGPGHVPNIGAPSDSIVAAA